MSAVYTPSPAAIRFKLANPCTASSSPVSANLRHMAQFAFSSSKLGSKDSMTQGPSYPMSCNAVKNSSHGTSPVPGIPRLF